MSNFSITTELITTIVAVVALLLSIFNFVVDRIDKKAKLIVFLSQGKIDVNSPKGNSSEDGIFVEVINSSHSKTTVMTVSILAKGNSVVDLDNFFTHEQQSSLGHGENAIYQLTKKELLQALTKENIAGRIKIRAGATTALRTTFLSKAIIIDTNQHSAE